MASHPRRTIGDAKIQLVTRTHIHRCSDRHILTLILDSLADIEASPTRFVRLPGISIEAGVEVNVAFDESWNDKFSAEIDLLPHGDPGFNIGADRHDSPLCDRNG
jgi:hypothetical protein